MVIHICPWYHRAISSNPFTQCIITAINVNLATHGFAESALPFITTRKIAHVTQHYISIFFWSSEKDYAKVSNHQEGKWEYLSIAFDETDPCVLDSILGNSVLQNINKQDTIQSRVNKMYIPQQSKYLHAQEITMRR